jgi:hypothetical protein
VWIQAGYELDYYPYAAHRVDFAHKVGVLPSVQRLDIKDIVHAEGAREPAHARFRAAPAQAFAVFTMPGDPKEYATAIGTISGQLIRPGTATTCSTTTIRTRCTSSGPRSLWQAIDQHQPKPGMTELETAMALGVMQQSDSSNYGNRTVEYDAGGKHWSSHLRERQGHPDRAGAHGSGRRIAPGSGGYPRAGPAPPS